MAKEVIVTADILRKRKHINRIVKISLLSLSLFLIIVYIVLQIIYNEGNFTIILDSDKTRDAGIAIYESLNSPHGKRKLEAESVVSMDNISWKWLPNNINDIAEGAHNGENYIAYTFYVENQGENDLHYWYEIIVDDVIRNVDEAIRIMIYQNGEATTYAKKKSNSDAPEEGTTMFIEKGDTIILEQRKDFFPENVDKYTIVIWLEGDDPDCTDPLKGGAMKMHMKITEEYIRK